jgi:hypothetical protein
MDPTSIRASITTHAGFEGHTGLSLSLASGSNVLVLQINKSGTGGSINAVSQINIQDVQDGALLTYDATASLTQAPRIANNPSARASPKLQQEIFFEKGVGEAIVLTFS